MKKIIFKFLILFIILIFICGIVEVLSIVPNIRPYIAKLANAGESRLGSDELEPILSWVKEEDTSNKLVIGDSVANQLFGALSGVNADYKVATGNQAFTMIWQYIFVKEYIANHPNATDIYFIITPNTLGSEIEPLLSYQYVAIPLIQNGYLHEVDKLAHDELLENFGNILLQPSVVYLMDKSCINRKLYYYLAGKKHWKTEEGNKTVLSSLSEDYLRKMVEYCTEKQVTFHLIPAPIKDIQENHEMIQNIKTEFEKSGLIEFFPHFCDDIVLYPADMFKDSLHFSDEYADSREWKNKVIDTILATDEEYKGLWKVYMRKGGL